MIRLTYPQNSSGRINPKVYRGGARPSRNIVAIIAINLKEVKYYLSVKVDMGEIKRFDEWL